MNIFVTNKDPIEAARHLDDKRVSKMLVETVQILSHIFGGPYKLAWHKHPCVLWAKADARHTMWLIKYLDALHTEYRNRMERHHKSYVEFVAHAGRRVIEAAREFEYYDDIEFCNCSLYKDMPDVFQAYQMTLCDKWDTDLRTPRWYGVTQ